MRGIMRDHFSVDKRPPVYGKETFEHRFLVPRSVFTRIEEAIRDRPLWRQSINATGRARPHFLQRMVAAFCVLTYGWSYYRADEYVWLSNFTTDMATTKLISFIVDEW